jgi:hypothetical protein
VSAGVSRGPELRPHAVTPGLPFDQKDVKDAKIPSVTRHAYKCDAIRGAHAASRFGIVIDHVKGGGAFGSRSALLLASVSRASTMRPLRFSVIRWTI